MKVKMEKSALCHKLLPECLYHLYVYGIAKLVHIPLIALRNCKHSFHNHHEYRPWLTIDCLFIVIISKEMMPTTTTLIDK